MMWPFKTRTIRVPASNETTGVEVVDCWSVRWCGGSWSSGIGEKMRFWDRREYIEVFLNQHDAEAFANSLRNAYTLLRLKGAKAVTVERETRA